MAKKKTKEEFIKEATEKHNGKYDYSKAEYVNNKTKVCIICPKHGEFWQIPDSHLRGSSCSKCANEATGERCRSTLSNFITKACKVHGEKYDYSKVNYVNNETKVCIICPEHGEFWQRPADHIKGQGCPKCKSNKTRERLTLTKEEFIKKAREKHGDKYDYTKVVYVNSLTKVCINCHKHGEFLQTPNVHIQYHGCPKCGAEKISESLTSSKEEFIKKAKEIHKNKYDYSEVEYVSSKTKVCIICHKPGHDDFWQRPNDHLSGNGCPKCANEATGERCRSSKEVFIKKVHKVHGDKYDYSKVNYVNNETKVCIICPEHGEFWQTPDIHTQGSGCPKCKGDKTRERLTLSIEEFIKKARKEHGDKYDYSKVDYVNAHTKVCIICPEHGEFKQKPNGHLSGYGCPKCNLSHLERSVMNYLDEAGIFYEYQKRFDWLGKQSLDFYISEYNVGIECQGEQHFFPIDFAGKGVEWACKQFNKTVFLDKRKKKLCEKHGVKLLYLGNTPNYNTFLGEAVHDDVKHLIDYLNEHKIDRDKQTTE